MAWGWLGESMLQKSRARSKTKKYLHRNLGAGHIIPNEHYLERAGLRGRKAWCCWGAVLLALFVALGNLAVTCLILGVLRFDSTGFTYFTFSDSSTIWPRQGANLSNITMATPHCISGYRNSPLALSGGEGSEIRSAVASGSHYTLTQSSLNLSAGDTVSMRNRNGQQLLFANSSLLQVNGLSAVGQVKTPQVTTHMISEVNSISSAERLLLRGEGGVTVKGGVVNITAGGNVTLKGQRMVVSGNRGVVMEGLGTSPSMKYHLCITGSGIVFIIPSNPRGCLGPTD